MMLFLLLFFVFDSAFANVCEPNFPRPLATGNVSHPPYAYPLISVFPMNGSSPIATTAIFWTAHSKDFSKLAILAEEGVFVFGEIPPPPPGSDWDMLSEWDRPLLCHFPSSNKTFSHCDARTEKEPFGAKCVLVFSDDASVLSVSVLDLPQVIVLDVAAEHLQPSSTSGSRSQHCPVLWRNTWRVPESNQMVAFSRLPAHSLDLAPSASRVEGSPPSGSESANAGATFVGEPHFDAERTATGPNRTRNASLPLLITVRGRFLTGYNIVDDAVAFNMTVGLETSSFSRDARIAPIAGG